MTRSLSFASRRQVALGVALAALLFTTACGNTTGRAPSYLVIDQLLAASGAATTKFSNTLESDVETKGSVYEDLGEVQLHMAMRDTTDTTAPSATNVITLERYHVAYVRSDGRSVEGVDVPYAFDGASTATITSTTSTVGFVLVRAQAKVEAPLLALCSGGGSLLISTIAQVTFYGHDQAGNSVSVTGSISVNFADWADPSSSS